MNQLENIVSKLPKEYKDRVDKADCDFCTGNCESLDIIEDYINHLEEKVSDLIIYNKTVFENPINYDY